MTKKSNSILTAATLIGFISVASSASVYGWQAPGGTTASGCGANDGFYVYADSGGACEYAGYGWTHFTYTSNMPLKTSLTFPGTKNQGGNKTISGDCVEYGGFWHYGYLHYKNDGTRYPATGNSYWKSSGGVASVGNPQYNNAGYYLEDHRTFDLVSGYNHAVIAPAVAKGYSQEFYMPINGTVKKVAYADGFGADVDVYKDYKNYLNKSGESAQWWLDNHSASELGSFCWGDKVSATTFTASSTAKVNNSTGTQTNPVMVNDASFTVNFTHVLKRNSDGVTEKQHSTYNVDVNNYNKTSNELSQGGTQNITATKTGTLGEGETGQYCSTIYYHNKVTYNNQQDTTATSTACVWVKRRAWATYEGQVVPVVNNADQTANKGSSDAPTVWIDSNYANLRFKHQLKRTNSVSAATWFQTARSTGVSSSFNQKTTWQDSTVTNNSWKTEFNSNESNISVEANRSDTNISTFCQNLYYYPRVREDRGAYDSYVTRTGCVKIRPNKTTFAGAIKIEVKINGTWVEKRNGDSINFTADALPENVEVRFTHTVTRSNSDAHTSSGTKQTYIKTTLGSTTGYRDKPTADPHGTAKNTTYYNLSKGGVAKHEDKFTTKIYPEQTIKLCQKLEYRSMIWGDDPTDGATVGEYCITLTKSKISCMGNQFGINNAANYLKMTMYKNGSKVNGTGDTLETGNTNYVVWAKPNDTIRYKYSLCAAGELASQFKDNYITSYSISSSSTGPANGKGYLFGKTLSSPTKYEETYKLLGSSVRNPGVGPFESGSNHLYEMSYESPSDGTGSMYSCAGGGTTDYYRIPGIRPNDPNYTSLKNNCNSAGYGEVSDVGTSFSQTATWSDIKYSSGGNIRNGTATVTGKVNVPYNYKTSVSTSAGGGSVILGHDIVFDVKIGISRRVNKQVNDSEAYVTYTKPTKYQILEFVIPASVKSSEASAFNEDITKNNEYLSGTSDGFNKNCYIAGRKCTVAQESDSTVVYGEGSDQNIEGSTFTRSIDDNGSNYPIGTKLCYVAAIWPADSHDAKAADINSNNQDIALSTNSNLWHLSKASCYTVSKRPSMAILNADAYAAGGIKGITNERLNSETSAKAIFGSWSEYGLVAGVQGNTSKGQIIGVASGAVLRGGVSVPGAYKKSCYFSSLTFTNTNCDDLGKLPVDSTMSSYPARIADQIISRYTARSDATANVSGANINILGSCSLNESTGLYEPTDGNYKCLNNGTKYVHVKTGDAYLAGSTGICMGRGSSTTSRTIVIDADNTLYIQENLVYGANTGTVLRARGCYDNEYTNIAQIPQLILIGKTIVIDQSVTHIDAWLIADKVQTCNISKNKVDKLEDRDANGINLFNATSCTETLTINGPVITKTLNLYRTAGGKGNGTNGKSAEVMYLGPETYLWAYNQAARYSQATTTYQRELAPRY